MGPILVGTSGWDYPSWSGDFYPAEVAQADRLEYLAERFPTVELNASFYRLQQPASYERWRDATPDDFVFAVKGSRYITHLKRLREPEVALANFLASGPLALEHKLGPMLWQLPANLQFDPDLLASFLDCLPKSHAEAAALARTRADKVERPYVAVRGDRPLRHALEIRHSSYEDPRFFDLLNRHRIACVVSDGPEWPLIDHQTSDFAYVRLHGHDALYASQYRPADIESWAQRCLKWAANGPVYVYFDNDSLGYAPHDAASLVHATAA